MSQNFSAEQYETVYNPKALAHWEVPKKFRKHPRSLEGFTEPVTKQDGHFLDEVYKPPFKEWSQFQGTWGKDFYKPGSSCETTSSLVSAAINVSCSTDTITRLESSNSTIRELIPSVSNADVNEVATAGFSAETQANELDSNLYISSTFRNEYVPHESALSYVSSMCEEDVPNEENVDNRELSATQQDDSSSLQVKQADIKSNNVTSDTKKGRCRKKREQVRTSRKRKRDSSKWERNIRRSDKVKGKQYVSITGKIIPAKALKPPCSCRRKCHEKFTDEQRQKIFNAFYLLSANSQDQFIAYGIEESDNLVRRARKPDQVQSRRNFTRRYFLPQNGGSRIEVCQVMFLNTLDIKLGKVKIISLKKRQNEAGICTEDRRGRHGHQKKIPAEAINAIKDHINQFPVYKSHYSRLYNEKKYLSSDLNITKMYGLYKTYCVEKNIQPQKETFYRKIFVEEFNLSFLKPAVDSCTKSKCEKYRLKLNSLSDLDTKNKIQQEHT